MFTQPLRAFRKVFIGVPRARIELYRKESPKIAGGTVEERLAEDLAADFAQHALEGISDAPLKPWSFHKVNLSGRPLEIEGRQPDLSFDGMKAWIVLR